MNCEECGIEFIPKLYAHLTEWCLTCDFWLWHVARANTPESVRMAGTHYRLGNPVRSAMDKSGLGFGGREWVIRFDDGRIVKTNNLWHQGDIPERFQDRLPDNADTGEYVV